MAAPQYEQQFLEVYDKYADAIFRYCYYRVFDREKAKDVVQEAYCRTWKYLAEGHAIDNMRAFIYRTANNIIIDDSRKHKNVSLDGIMEKGYAPKTDPRASYQAHFAGKEALEVIELLDPKYRDVILLKYVNDLSTKEIAFIVNETENNVYVRISRGFEKVKKLLEEKETVAKRKFQSSLS